MPALGTHQPAAVGFGDGVVGVFGVDGVTGVDGVYRQEKKNTKENEENMNIYIIDHMQEIKPKHRTFQILQLINKENEENM